MSERSISQIPRGCAYLWTHVVADFGKAQLRTCCKTQPFAVTAEDLARHGAQLLNNSPEIRQARREMMTTGQPKRCSVCLDLEQQNRPSHRSSQREYLEQLAKAYDRQGDVEGIDWATTIRENLEPGTFGNFPDNLDIQLDNTCDLKCLYCSGEYSSSWAAEQKEFGPMPQEPVRPRESAPSAELLDQFQSTLWSFLEATKMGYRRIAFLGGEPLLSPRFPAALEKLVAIYADQAPRDLEINIISNLNTPTLHFDRFLATLRSAPAHLRFNINVSMEAVEERAEMIRYRVRFARFRENFRSLLALSASQPLGKIQVSTITTLNLFSLDQAPDYLRWVREREIESKREVTLYFHIVSFPEWMATDLAPAALAEHLDRAVEFLRTSGSERSPGGIENWRHYAEQLSQLARRVRQQTQPELLRETRKLRLLRSALHELQRRRQLDLLAQLPSDYDELRSALAAVSATEPS
ncbi:MAG TPA: twitch domain-containing radical SAM protein [Pseudobdellovibrionaceae bacterium]|nr:twitch domain-containing radical SAM protein [Pseudobdellovibrionaceae bacterium]